MHTCICRTMRLDDSWVPGSSSPLRAATANCHFFGSKNLDLSGAESCIWTPKGWSWTQKSNKSTCWCLLLFGLDMTCHKWSDFSILKMQLQWRNNAGLHKTRKLGFRIPKVELFKCPRHCKYWANVRTPEFPCRSHDQDDYCRCCRRDEMMTVWKISIMLFACFEFHAKGP